MVPDTDSASGNQRKGPVLREEGKVIDQLVKRRGENKAGHRVGSMKVGWVAVFDMESEKPSQIITRDLNDSGEGAWV